MARWQYITVKVIAGGFFGWFIDRGKLESLLQERSADGWELVTAVPVGGFWGPPRDFLLIFKRPI